VKEKNKGKKRRETNAENKHFGNKSAEYSKVRKRGEKSKNTENMRLKTTGLGLQGRVRGKVSD
jgi:hypothetical protein